LREIVILFFVAVAVSAIVRFGDGAPVVAVTVSMVALTIATFFHTAVVGAFVAPLWLGLEQLRRRRIAYVLSFVIASAVYVGVIVAVERSGAGLDYVGGSLSNVDFDFVVDRSDRAAYGGLSYLEGVVPSSVPVFVLQLPVRLAYFLWSPFPWQIRELQHVLGIVDGVIFAALAVLVVRARDGMFRSVVLRTLLVMVVGFSLVHAVGVSNSGTAIRHRQKIYPALAVLAAASVARRVDRNPLDEKHIRPCSSDERWVG
jgi:uncharacterized membrane protein